MLISNLLEALRYLQLQHLALTPDAKLLCRATAYILLEELRIANL